MTDLEKVTLCPHCARINALRGVRLRQTIESTSDPCKTCGSAGPWHGRCVYEVPVDSDMQEIGPVHERPAKPCPSCENAGIALARGLEMERLTRENILLRGLLARVQYEAPGDPAIPGDRACFLCCGDATMGHAWSCEIGQALGTSVKPPELEDVDLPTNFTPCAQCGRIMGEHIVVLGKRGAQCP